MIDFFLFFAQLYKLRNESLFYIDFVFSVTDKNLFFASDYADESERKSKKRKTKILEVLLIIIVSNAFCVYCTFYTT